MNTKEKVKCRECGNFILREEAIEFDGSYYCEDCFYEEYTHCSDCGCIIASSDASVINSGRSTEREVCDRCRHNYFRCTSCGEYVTSDNVWASDEDMLICNRCSDGYMICHDCDRIVSTDMAYYSSVNDNYYCEDCYSERNTSYIEDYSYKPYPEFLGESEEGLYLGVELEVDEGCNIYDTTKTLCDNFKDIYLKHDGSLSSSGFEIVSHPATLDYHMYELGWEGIMDICKENDFRSHDTRTCGLHLHLSRTFLGKDETEQDLNIAKLVILFDLFWDRYIVPFSRRKMENISRWAEKPSVECLNTDTENELVDKIKSYKSQGRYKAINLQNDNTIEFRLFRGTLNINTFMASLQFTVAITKFVKQIKLKDVFAVKWSDIFVSEDFKELKEYLRKRNLTGEEN